MSAPHTLWGIRAMQIVLSVGVVALVIVGWVMFA